MFARIDVNTVPISRNWKDQRNCNKDILHIIGKLSYFHKNIHSICNRIIIHAPETCDNDTSMLFNFKNFFKVAQADFLTPKWLHVKNLRHTATSWCCKWFFIFTYDVWTLNYTWFRVCRCRRLFLRYAHALI